jgi:hypothetical protein
LAEELGWSRRPGRLLAVDWSTRSGPEHHLIHVYDGGLADAGDLAGIRLQEDELTEWRLVTAAEAEELLRPQSAARLAAARSGALSAAGGRAVELRDGRPVGPVGPDGPAGPVGKS